MTLLHRYMVRQNLFLLLLVLVAGTAIYLLTDIIERMDVFLDAGLGFKEILLYCLLKTPTIISQILPAVFLLAMVLQLNILDRSRELIALRAGGLSPLVLARFVLVYGLFWAVAQLFFSQAAGAAGEQAASRMWQEQVRGNDLSQKTISGLWFTEGARVIHIDTAYPNQGKGLGLLIYRLDDQGLGIEEIVRAESFTIEKDDWRLQNAMYILPGSFSSERRPEMTLPLKQDLKAFGTVEAMNRPTEMPLWELSALISRLKKSGSNVEGLRTAWHGKLAYAASIVAMGLVALVISQVTGNIYKAMGLSLLGAFLFYSLNTWCSALGSKGIVPPMVGGWLGVLLPTGACLFVLFLPNLRRSFR